MVLFGQGESNEFGARLLRWFSVCSRAPELYRPTLRHIEATANWHVLRQSTAGLAGRLAQDKAWARPRIVWRIFADGLPDVRLFAAGLGLPYRQRRLLAPIPRWNTPSLPA